MEPQPARRYRVYTATGGTQPIEIEAAGYEGAFAALAAQGISLQQCTGLAYYHPALQQWVAADELLAALKRPAP